MKGLPFKLEYSLELVDLTGRTIRQDKRGSIDLSLAPILQRLYIPSKNWHTIAIEFEKHTHAAVGTELILSNYYQNAGYKRRPKIGKTKQLFG